MNHTVALETYTQSISCKTKVTNHNDNIIFKFYQATKYIGRIINRTTQEQQIHISPEKRKCGGFGQEADFSGEVFASKYFLTIQKDQLHHTARTGNRCRMGANIAQRELKTVLFKRFILHPSHLCPPAENSPKIAASPASCPSLVCP